MKNYSKKFLKYLIKIWGDDLTSMLLKPSALYLGKSLEELNEKEFKIELKVQGHPCLCN